MHPAPIGAEIGLIALWMQQLSRRVLPRAGLLNFACQATGSHSSALSRKTAAEPNAQHTLAQWYSPSCVRAPAGQAASSSYRWSKPLGVHKGFCNPFATKAEEYDLIVTEAGLVRIEGYDDTGFIVNDVQVQGGVFCVGDLFTMWKVGSKEFKGKVCLHADLVILGCGKRAQMVPPNLQTYFKQHKIAFEAIDTANAVSTFNILNQEGRKVAGVLLPAGSS